MDLNITPSKRKGSAQRMLAATTLMCEGILMLFAGLVAHGLAPQTRLWSWLLAIVAMLALFVVAGRLGKGSARPYWLGLLMQIPMICFGVFLPVMWVVGLIFALLYWGLVVMGRKMDLEKDAVDERYYKEHGGRP